MITLESLITRVENRLQLAAGLDVQIHAEDTFIEMVRHKYTVLLEDFWFDEYMTYETFNLDGTTGKVVEDLTSKIRIFGDLHSVYYESEDDPLPRISYNQNPTKVRTRCIAPTTDNKIFKLVPTTTTGKVHVWYRTRLADSQWDLADPALQINMDAELLVLGVAYDFASGDGGSLDDAGKLKAMFDARVKQLRSRTWNQPLSKTSQSLNMPTTWGEEWLGG